MLALLAKSRIRQRRERKNGLIASGVALASKGMNIGLPTSGCGSWYPAFDADAPPFDEIAKAPNFSDGASRYFYLILKST